RSRALRSWPPPTATALTRLLRPTLRPPWPGTGQETLCPRQTLYRAMRWADHQVFWQLRAHIAQHSSSVPARVSDGGPTSCWPARQPPSIPRRPGCRRRVRDGQVWRRPCPRCELIPSQPGLWSVAQGDRVLFEVQAVPEAAADGGERRLRCAAGELPVVRD